MAHHHNHNHSKEHHHARPDNQGHVIVVTIVLNMAFVIIEFAYGFIANSTALMADAGHNISDVLGLILAWGAVILTRKPPSKRYTYGLRSTSIMAALVNAMLLLVACGAIALEAIQRFSQPPTVASLTVSSVAGIGIVINGLSAWLLMKGSKDDLNIRGAYLHMAADTAVSLAVVIAGIAMFYTGWFMLDPIISLLIVIVIVIGTWSLLRDSMQLALSAVPAKVDALAIDSYLRQLAGVTDIHDLHIWGLSTTESALTVHLVMPNGHPGDIFLDEIVQTLDERFFVHHSTLQIEQGTTNHSCSLSAIKQLRHHH
ncbi:MAG: cation diffusion facilitator family transporter [Methylococcaceae bacterium]|nr:cation diffusion facilitator family transporter [Methylococcaceae bacterium]MDD1641949.1 cation diffusion facilitator family transporter [Methylococcaceae bacterium]